MKNKLIIIGAGGHGKVAKDIGTLNGFSEIFFLDDNVMDSNVLGKIRDADKFKDDWFFFVAIGNNDKRMEILSALIANGYKIATLIHPFSYVSNFSTIGIGSIIMAGAIVNCKSTIGIGSIINTSSSIDHECFVGSFSHIAVGAHVCGSTKIGNNCFIGAGTTIINNLMICDNTIIGAGATVITSIYEAGTYVGIPATKINEN